MDHNNRTLDRDNLQFTPLMLCSYIKQCFILKSSFIFLIHHIISVSKAQLMEHKVLTMLRSKKKKKEFTSRLFYLLNKLPINITKALIFLVARLMLVQVIFLTRSEFLRSMI